MSYQPANWLQNLARISPAPRWPWRHSLRLILGTTIPMAIGYMSGQVLPAMIVCLGAMLTSIAVQTEPYHARFHRIWITAPIGMSGYFLGALIGGHDLWTISALVVIALVSGIISGYGAAFSAGAMQMLIMAIVAAHASSEASIWIMPSLFLVGALYAAFLLKIEALVSPHQPEINILTALIKSLENLANTTAKLDCSTADTEAARRNVTDAQEKAYASLMNGQQYSEGRSQSGDYIAAIVASTDRIASILFAKSADKKILKQSADWLSKIADDIIHQRTKPSQSAVQYADDRLIRNIMHLSEVLWPRIRAEPFALEEDKQVAATLSNKLSFTQLGMRFFVGREVVISAFRLALCILIAFVAEFYVPGNRSYWIPLSVAVILKPDFGSVFVRAALRSAGTLTGVILATIILLLIPKGPLLILSIGILSCIIPWAGLKSYALQCMFLTPLILILIDFIVPGPTVNYGMQRLTDTIIGSSIVLVFGYLIWPKSIKTTIKQNFSKALSTIAEYLRQSFIDTGSQQTEASKIINQSAYLRRAAYKELSDLRIQLHRSCAEPPPASTEALAWLPVISGAERICDNITSLADMCDASGQTPNTDIVANIANSLDSLAQTGRNVKTNALESLIPLSEVVMTQADKIISEINEEVQHLGEMLTE